MRGGKKAVRAAASEVAVLMVAVAQVVSAAGQVAAATAVSEVMLEVRWW